MFIFRASFWIFSGIYEILILFAHSGVEYNHNLDLFPCYSTYMLWFRVPFIFILFFFISSLRTCFVCPFVCYWFCLTKINIFFLPHSKNVLICRGLNLYAKITSVKKEHVVFSNLSRPSQNNLSWHRWFSIIPKV